jgi:hypothetical protein
LPIPSRKYLGLTHPNPALGFSWFETCRRTADVYRQVLA